MARELGIITAGECTRRLVQTLTTLLRMEHHEPSGMFYNWYDEAAGEVLTSWPGTGDRVYPFLSSVDNGWLGAALMVVRSADRGAAPLADRLFGRMRWDMFYDPDASRPGGLMHGGFYDAPPPNPDATFTGNHIGVGPDVWYTKHHYDTTVSETRITSYLGILTGQVPARHYFAMWRTFPATCDWSWPEMQPVGQTRTYLGLDVFEGAYTYRGMHIVPGWGGNMFEELMPDVFVPEASWAPRQLGCQPPAARAGPARARPGRGRLRLLGLLARRATPSAATASTASTPSAWTRTATSPTARRPTTTPASATAAPRPTRRPTYGDGVVTPHASFLAMMHAPRQAYANLARIQSELGAYGDGGFFDAVAVRSGTIARRYLSLDQAMVDGRHRKRAGGQRDPPRIRHPRCRARAAPRHRHGGVRSRAGLTGPPPQGVDVSTMERQ